MFIRPGTAITFDHWCEPGTTGLAESSIEDTAGCIPFFLGFYQNPNRNLRKSSRRTFISQPEGGEQFLNQSNLLGLLRPIYLPSRELAYPPTVWHV